MLSVGKYRHLTQCSNAQGIIAVLAIDHRQNEMSKDGNEPKTYADIVAFKRRVLHHLATATTAVLTDPDYGLPAMLSGDLPGNVGLLAPLERTDYTRSIMERGMDMLPDWGVSQIKQAGFNGAKLYMMFHPDAPNAAEKTAFVDSIIAQCDRHQIPFFYEPIAYSLDPDKPLSSAEKRQIVIANAKHFTGRGVDVLKMEFPLDCHEETDRAVWREAAAELDAACTVPWALLSAGVTFDLFIEQAVVACAAGASGVIAGRAIWGDAVGLPPADQDRWLATTGRDRMERLTAVCRGLGQSWQTRQTPPALGERWYAG